MSADSLSHIVGAALSVSLGVLVIVDAKPGAGGNIASEFVSRATPDGYTITLRTGSHAVSAALYKKLRFHPVDSFDFISLTGTFPFVVATRNDGPIASGEGAFTDLFPQRSLKFRARQGQLLAQSRRSRARLLLGAERTCHTGGLRSPFVKGFGRRPHEGRRRVFGGRRPKASKGGNRAGGTEGRAADAMGI